MTREEMTRDKKRRDEMISHDVRQHTQDKFLS